MKEVYISDINAELINTYRVIRDDIDELIGLLLSVQRDFISLDTDHRKEYYFQQRDRFNCIKLHGDESTNIEKAALMVFLNKTCFNGLYRVNKKGLFNVPMGAYKNPLICDEDNLRMVSEKLQNVQIVCRDYSEAERFIDSNDKFCAILMGDTRQKGHMIPMSFDVMRIFEDAGFKLKELVIKEQHNCKATGYWKTNSVKYNFLLIAHEYLFIFRKKI